ncbi:MAG TPA: hypothetical protein VF494_10910 [Candidatus Limnocylindrales bacterium]
MSLVDRPPHHRRRPSWLRLGALLAIVLVTVGVVAVATDVVGAGRLFDRAVAKIDRIIAGPVPDRPTVETVLVTPRPVASPSPTPTPPTPSSSDHAGVSASPSAEPTPTPTPTPERVPVDVDIAADPAAIFASEVKDTWCSPAAVQIALAFLGKADTSDAFQRELQGRVREWESYSDSHDGLWGPAAMALALKAYGAPGYEVRAYKTRQDALRDAATAIELTESPVILLAWRGAHAWVMTGFRADADPAIFPDSTIAGGYVVDPWYPRVSSIWGPSDPPGTFQDNAEMIRNYLPWKRPEGRYPNRDGLFISVVPTVKAPAGN